MESKQLNLSLAICSALSQQTVFYVLAQFWIMSWSCHNVGLHPMVLSNEIESLKKKKVLTMFLETHKLAKINWIGIHLAQFTCLVPRWIELNSSYMFRFPRLHDDLNYNSCELTNNGPNYFKFDPIPNSFLVT